MTRTESTPRAIRPRRSVPLKNAPMECAPTNEMGVVFLFAHKAQSLGYRIAVIRSGFPDCIAYRQAGDHEREVRIEFEFRSRSFLSHGHNADGCDCIVCWEHDWPDCPKHLEIVELRTMFGLPPNVWMQPAISTQWHWLENGDECTWAVSPRARKGDLLLMYRCRPLSAITDVYRIEGIQQRKSADWRAGECFDVPIQRIARLRQPIPFAEMREHHVLRNAGFVRGNMQGVRQVSEYWAVFYQMMTSNDAVTGKRLKKFAPTNS